MSSESLWKARKALELQMLSSSHRKSTENWKKTLEHAWGDGENLAEIGATEDGMIVDSKIEYHFHGNGDKDRESEVKAAKTDLLPEPDKKNHSLLKIATIAALAGGTFGAPIWAPAAIKALGYVKEQVESEHETEPAIGKNRRFRVEFE